LASKSEKYWFDAEALIEPAKTQSTRQGRDIWQIPSASVKGHRAPFPRDLARRAIAAGCPPGGTVLDPFAGSGTTLAVAQSLGRKAIGIEVSPESCAISADACGQQELTLLTNPH
jgi:DNA modification methylase